MQAEIINNEMQAIKKDEEMKEAKEAKDLAVEQAKQEIRDMRAKGFLAD